MIFATMWGPPVMERWFITPMNTIVIGTIKTIVKLELCEPQLSDFVNGGPTFHDANWFHHRPSEIRRVAEALASHWACAQGEGGGFWLKGPWRGGID